MNEVFLLWFVKEMPVGEKDIELLIGARSDKRPLPSRAIQDVLHR